jgi:hypothetical protein
MITQLGTFCGALVFALALAGAVARADNSADACRMAPTRACVLEIARATASAVPQIYTRANILLAIAALEQRSGLSKQSDATFAVASDAIKQIPPDSELGTPPPALVAVYAARGDMAKAIDLARSFDKPLPRVAGLASVAAAMQRQGHIEDAKTFYAEAVDVAEASPVERRSQLLMLAARSEANVGSPDAPATFDLAITAAKLSGAAVGPLAIVGQRIRSGEFERAFLDIDDLPDNSHDFLLRTLVTAQAEAGKIDDAMSTATSISSDPDRVIAYGNLAAADFRSGRAMAGVQMLAKLQEIADGETVPTLKAEASAVAAGAEALGGMTARSKAHFDDALRALVAEDVPALRDSLAENIARALMRANQPQEALDTLHVISEARSQSYVLSDIVTELTAAGRFGEAFVVLAAIPTDELRVNAMLEYVDKLPK